MNLEEYRSDRERFLNDLNDIENLIKISDVRNFLGIDDDILKNFTYKDLKKFVLDKINNLSDLEKRELLELKKNAMDKYYNGNGLILFASKALCTMHTSRIVTQEGLGADVVSAA